ncbi:MAG TPA: TonB-dependent receptor plug domain-containing protein [Hansschlegelia sp.]
MRAVALIALVAASPNLFAKSAVAQEATPLPGIVVVGAQGGHEPHAVADLSSAQLQSYPAWTSDTASLVDAIPGGSALGGGPVSSLPAINGMGADRVQVSANGMILNPACPNEMNPPLSFSNPAMLDEVKAYDGAAPVSVGGDFTGGKIVTSVAKPRFAEGPEWKTQGFVSGFYRSNGDGFGVDGGVTVSNDEYALTYRGGWAKSSDYRGGDGKKVRSTMYETQNHALSLSRRWDGNQLTLEVGGQYMPRQGFVNQYMDLVDNKGFHANGAYDGQFDWGTLEAKAFVNRVRHTMGFVAPDKTGDMPMDTRSTDLGYSIDASIPRGDRDVVRIGNELNYNHLDDWWGAVAGSMMMGPDTFQNVHNGRRGRVGTYAEWERRWTPEWTSILGVRNDVVWMNTGDVHGYSEMMDGADAAAFNAQSHGKTDVHLDASALLRYEPDAASSYELSLARKTRSPNLYERYAWSTGAMAMSMIGWFGDGNGYVGNLDLKSEKAHTVSFAASWKDPVEDRWSVRVAPFYSYVEDFIDVDRCKTESCLSNRADNATARDGFVYLRFANHDAWLAGVNVDARYRLWSDDAAGVGELVGKLGYVRGKRTDGVNLYRIMPLNGALALNHRLGGWTSGVELQLVAKKNDVSQEHNELKTASYAVVNLRAAYEWESLKIEAGLRNVFDKNYILPLGGADLSSYGGADGYGVRGAGRSLDGRVTVKF